MNKSPTGRFFLPIDRYRQDVRVTYKGEDSLKQKVTKEGTLQNLETY